MGIALVLQLINGIVGLASLVLAIIVLIKLYNAEGAGQAVLGLICGLYLFFWGWKNADRLGFTKEMNWWKLCVGAQIVLMVLFVVVGMVAGA
jgi:hypothetical protein